MNIFKRIKRKWAFWRKNRENEKFMRKFAEENPWTARWGIGKQDEHGNFIFDETCSYGPWIGNKMIDITGNRDKEKL
jgi:hypothetical protein